MISAFLAPSMTAFGWMCAITLTTLASAILAILSSVLPWPSLMDANLLLLRLVPVLVVAPLELLTDEPRPHGGDRLTPLEHGWAM